VVKALQLCKEGVYAILTPNEGEYGRGMERGLPLVGRQRIPNEPIEELREMSWKEYINSYYWKRFSKSILDDEDVTCGICDCRRWNGKYIRGKRKGKRRRLRQFHCHHLNYDNRGKEVVGEDVLVLCQKCHETAHSIEALASSRGGIWEKVYDLVKKLTPWEYEKFEKKEK
jgi:hypothetical protein